MPPWYTDEIFKSIKGASRDLFDSQTVTLAQKKFSIGPLVRRIIENMEEGDEIKHSKKIYLYSGHDRNVHAFSRALNYEIPTEGFPEFGSAFIIEKHRNIENNMIYVQVSKSRDIFYFLIEREKYNNIHKIIKKNFQKLKTYN